MRTDQVQDGRELFPPGNIDRLTAACHGAQRVEGSSSNTFGDLPVQLIKNLSECQLQPRRQRCEFHDDRQEAIQVQSRHRIVGGHLWCINDRLTDLLIQ